jgi:hypothetical protein
MVRLSASGQIENGDAQSSLIANVSGWSLFNVQLGLQLLFVAMVEFSACFLLYASLNHGQSAYAAARAAKPDQTKPASTRRDQPRQVGQEVATAHDVPQPVAPRLAPPSLPVVAAVPPADALKRIAAPRAIETATVVSWPVVTAAATEAQEARRHGDIVDFVKAMFDFVGDEEAVIEQTAVYEHYRAWCSAQDIDAHNDKAFTALFGTLADGAEITRKRAGDIIYVFGVDLKPLPRRRARRAAY